MRSQTDRYLPVSNVYLLMPTKGEDIADLDDIGLQPVVLKLHAGSISS